MAPVALTKASKGKDAGHRKQSPPPLACNDQLLVVLVVLLFQGATSLQWQVLLGTHNRSLRLPQLTMFWQMSISCWHTPDVSLCLAATCDPRPRGQAANRKRDRSILLSTPWVVP